MKNKYVSWNSNKVIKLNPCETSRNDICSKSSMSIQLEQANHNEQMKVEENGKSLNSQAVKSNILDTSGDCSPIKQIAWIVSTASDVISENEKEGVDIDGPSFLYLVPSQERAAQIHSLKASEPEFVISTPERFLELVSLEAIDMSGLSLLVIDRLECCIRDGFLNDIKGKKQYIPDESQAVIFNGSLGSFSSSALQNLLGDHKAICRLSANVSIASQSVGISQSVDTCTSEEKLLKGIQILNKEYDMCSQSRSLKEIVCVDNLDEVGRMTNMDEFEVVIMISLPPYIGNYVSILT
ncbi:uncharacterized protein LOC113359575 [Papaver somniferum]|uniref:uncharacterized protein LOC113359575 n=1 Tax=Papaver somniferum TaxID=3469 RepID=UPI000E6F5936|nr:uncharacterized protein LOC113359575 [Papaver somniferum]